MAIQKEKKSPKTVVKTKRAKKNEVVEVVAMLRVPFIGNAPVRQFLWQAVDNSSLAHAYGFFGPENVGKTRCAREWAAKLVGVADERAIDIHSDVLFLDAREQSVSVAEIREVIAKLSESALLGGRRVAIIANADALSRDSLNTLLKTLEEPRGSTCCILTFLRPDDMLPTVMSRLARVQFSSVSDAEMMSGLLGYGDVEKVRGAVKLAKGAPGKAVRLLSDERYFFQLQRSVDFWSGLAELEMVERFLRIDEFFGTEKVFAVLQERAGELLDEVESFLDVGAMDKKNDRIGMVIKARRMLETNASPKAVMEWVVSGW